MKRIYLVVGFLALIIFAVACQNNASGFDKEFEKLCKDRTPNNWMSMVPMKYGKFISDKSCWGCMSDDGMIHFCSKEEYLKYLENEK